MRVDVLRMALASLKNAEMVLIKEAFDAAKPAEGEGEIAPIVVTLSEAAMQQTITRK